jgi:Predicted amidophosphoribosyltransferases
MNFKYILGVFIITKCLCCDKIIEYGGYLCGDCMKLWRNEMIDSDGEMICLANYDKYNDTVSKRLVLRMKSRNTKRLYRFMADELIKAINTKLPNRHEYIISNAPRMKNSIKANGLDHSKLLAKMIAERTGMKYMDTLRNKGREVQKILNYHERFKNADKAYLIRKQFNNNLHGYKFLVIDDITTTGATLKACGKILLDNGAADVKYAAICGGNDYKHEDYRQNYRAN